MPPPSVTSCTLLLSPKLKVTLLIVAPGEFPFAVKLIVPPAVAVAVSTDKLVQTGGKLLAPVVVGVASVPVPVGVGVSVTAPSVGVIPPDGPGVPPAPTAVT